MSTTRPVTISTPDGIDLAGVLRTPDDAARRAGVVLTGPFTGVKEQVVAIYAAGLAERGYITPSTTATSGPAAGSRGSTRTRAASSPTSELRPRSCSGSTRWPGSVAWASALAGYALRFTAFDPRVTALVTVAGAYNSPEAMRDGLGPAAYRRTLLDLAAAEQPGAEGLPSLPAVAEDGEAAMPGAEPFAYYGTERGRVPGWRNQVTRASIRQLLTFDAAIGADFVSPTPVRIIHGTRDDYCSPDAARATYDRIGEPRDLRWIQTTNHIDLYDQPDYVEPALDACAAWYDEHLVPEGSRPGGNA